MLLKVNVDLTKVLFFMLYEIKVKLLCIYFVLLQGWL